MPDLSASPPASSVRIIERPFARKAYRAASRFIRWSAVLFLLLIAAYSAVVFLPPIIRYVRPPGPEELSPLELLQARLDILETTLPPDYRLLQRDLSQLDIRLTNTTQAVEKSSTLTEHHIRELADKTYALSRSLPTLELHQARLDVLEKRLPPSTLKLDALSQTLPQLEKQFEEFKQQCTEALRAHARDLDELKRGSLATRNVSEVQTLRRPAPR